MNSTPQKRESLKKRRGRLGAFGVKEEEEEKFKERETFYLILIKS